MLFIITNYSVTNESETRLKTLYEKSIVVIRPFRSLIPTFCWFFREGPDKTGTARPPPVATSMGNTF